MSIFINEAAPLRWKCAHADAQECVQRPVSHPGCLCWVSSESFSAPPSLRALHKGAWALHSCPSLGLVGAMLGLQGRGAEEAFLRRGLCSVPAVPPGSLLSARLPKGTDLPTRLGEPRSCSEPAPGAHGAQQPQPACCRRPRGASTVERFQQRASRRQPSGFPPGAGPCKPHARHPVTPPRRPSQRGLGLTPGLPLGLGQGCPSHLPGWPACVQPPRLIPA